MPTLHLRALLSLSLFALLAAGAADAQNRTLTTPEASPMARVEQTVGLTQIAVTYHRPAVRGREIWGALVPYGEVWRAGANENTTFETSTDVMIEGQPLAAGRYGLHTIPEDGSWTIIFSSMADAWGSYSYTPEEDVLRVTVTPRTAGFAERLEYRLDAPSEETATLVLHWAEMEIPVEVTVDTPGVVLSGMERELRGVPGFYWESWNQIAEYALDNNRRLDDALVWVETSLARQPTFANRMTKAGLLDATGQSAEARELREDAHANASDDEIRAWARARQRAGQSEAAEEALSRLGG